MVLSRSRLRSVFRLEMVCACDKTRRSTATFVSHFVLQQHAALDKQVKSSHACASYVPHLHWMFFLLRVFSSITQ